MIFRVLLSALLLVAAVGLAAAPLARAAERDDAIWAAAAGEGAKAVETIKSLAAIESDSGNAAGLAEMAEALDDLLWVLGFATQRYPSPTGVGASTIVGTMSGEGSQKVLLLAHMDTVFAPGSLENMPIWQEGNRLYGPGVLSAKGGIAVVLHTVRALNDLWWSDYETLTVLFNPDHETGSTGSGALISALAAEADTVLSFEVGGDGARDMAWVLAGAAAYGNVRMEVTGHAAHAGSAPEQGSNALLELAYQLLRTKDVAQEIGGAQLNWTKVVSANADSEIPEKAVAIGDARISVEGVETELLAALQATAASSKLIANTEVELSLKILRPMLKPDEESLAVADLVKEIDAEIRQRDFFVVPMFEGDTDAGIAALSGQPVVLGGFGPSGGGMRTPEEYVEIDSIEASIYQVARLLIELGRRSDGD